MTLKFETNIGHVEFILRGDELSVEHEFYSAGKKYTKRINFDRKETKQITKLLKNVESE